MFNINDSFITDDLAALAEILNPAEEQTLKLEEGENRVVSVLFLDVKGFTAMSEKMKPEEVKLTMDKVLTVFTNSILKFGGYIDKYEGDLIMALFGCKTASETDTERAICAGLKILSDIKQVNQILKIDLAVRIGINTGEVTTGKIGMKREGDFTVYGDAVNLASRMESSAPLNSIMIPDETKTMVENIFLFEDLGVISVKGKEKPVSVWNVAGFSPKKVERWERSRSIIKHSLYVGRDSELNQISELYRISQSEIGTVDQKYKTVVIGLKGAAGIGKSRLVKEFFTIIKQQDNYLSGYTKSFAQPPYYLFTTMLKRYFKIEELDSREIVENKISAAYDKLIQATKFNKLLFEARNVVGYLFGVKYEDVRLEKVEPKTLQTLIILSIRHTIEAIAQVVNQQTNQPLIVFLDDCQWLDESSAALLKTFLIALNAESKLANLVNQNLFFLLTYRQEFAPFSEFQYDARFTEFELNPLTANNTQELIDSLVGRNSFSADFVQLIQQQSGGNPFYVEELVSYLSENGEIKITDGVAVMDKELNSLQIPLSLKNIILSRIDNLSDNLKNVLLRASIIGYRFFKTVLSEISIKLEYGNSIETEFNELYRDNWIFNEMEDNYLFKHILTADVCYNTILNYNKKIIHRLIAETIEELFQADLQEYYPDLAHHYEKAGVIDKAIKYLKKSGDNAMKNYQDGKALECYDKLIGYLDAEKDAMILIDVLRGRGSVFMINNKLEDAMQIFIAAIDRYRDTTYQKEIAAIYSRLAYVCQRMSRYEEGLQYNQTAKAIYEELNDTEGLAGCSTNIALIDYYQGKYDEALASYKKSIELIKITDNREMLGRCYCNIGNVYWCISEYKLAMKYYLRQLKISEELNNIDSIGRVSGNIGIVYNQLDNIEKALFYFKKAIENSEMSGDKYNIGNIYGNMGVLYLGIGDYKQAQFCFEKGYKIKSEGKDFYGMMINSTNFADVYNKLQDFDKADFYHTESIRLAESINAAYFFSEYNVKKAYFYFEQKRYSEAAAVLEAVKDSLHEQSEPFYKLVKIMVDCLVSEQPPEERFSTFITAMYERIVDPVNEDPSEKAEVYYLIWDILTKNGAGLHFSSEIANAKNSATQLYRELAAKSKYADYHERLAILSCCK